jgi:flavodoxin I
MNKVAIVYWSGTGNTEAIMKCVKQGIEQAGGTCDVYMPWDFSADLVDQYTNFAFGCPAMGNEQLETEDFQPMWDAVAPKLAGKNVVLFGSYNWNSGDYMTFWGEDAVQKGCNLVADGLAILDSPEPGSDDEKAAIALGQAIAKA